MNKGANLFCGPTLRRAFVAVQGDGGFRVIGNTRKPYKPRPEHSNLLHVLWHGELEDLGNEEVGTQAYFSSS